MADEPVERTSARRKPGRKPHVPPLKKRNLTLTDDQCKLLRMWGHGDMSAGLRWLIEAAAHLVRRVEPRPPRSSG